MSTLDTILVLVWKRPPAVEGVIACEAAMRALVEAHPDRQIGFYTLVDTAAQEGTPPAAVRDGVARMLKRHERSIRATVVVYEGTGFKATVVRSVVTAIGLASSSRVHNKVFSDRTEGAEWLVRQMQGTTRAGAQDIVRALTSPPEASKGPAAARA